MASQILNSVGVFEAVFLLLGLILIYNGLKRMFSCNQKPASNSTPTRRRIGRNEGLMDIMSEKRQGSTDISLIFTLRSETELMKDYVREALVLLAKRQPMLRAILTTSGESATATKDKYFEIMDGDEIADMIDLSSSEVKARQWQDVWKEVAFKERGTRLLWKAVMLQEEFLSEAQCYTNTLIFNFSHSSIDGVSSMKFCQQFLHYLNGLADGSFTSDEDISSLSMWPSFIDLLNRELERSSSAVWQFLASCLGIPRLIRLILRKLVRWKLSRKQRNPFFSQFPPPPKLSTPPNSNMILKIFNENETSNIVKACRLNGCSVTSALIAANHLAFCKLLQDGGYKGNNAQLEYSCAINGQRAFQTKPPKEYLGFYACGPTLLFPYTDESCFWSLANEVTKSIQKELIGEKYAKQHAAIFDLFSTEEIANEFFSPPDRQTMIRLSMCAAMSSIGSFDYREEQKHHRYKLHECIFNLLSHNLSFAFAHFNTTVNGKMSWVIIYDPSKIANDSLAQEFANLCFGYLIKICQ